MRHCKRVLSILQVNGLEMQATIGAHDLIHSVIDEVIYVEVNVEHYNPAKMRQTEMILWSMDTNNKAQGSNEFLGY